MASKLSYGVVSPRRSLFATALSSVLGRPSRPRSLLGFQLTDRRPLRERRLWRLDREYGRVLRERFVFQVRFDQRRAFRARGVAKRDHERVPVVVQRYARDFRAFALDD